MREKLIELLWKYDQMRMMRMSIEECTDHFIANGVTIPVRCDVCKFGEMCSIREAMACTTPDGYCWRGERRTDA